MAQEEPYWNPMVPELSVTHFDRSLRFYHEILGFSIKNLRTEPDFAYLALDQVQLMIEAVHLPGWQTGPLQHPLGRGVNFQMEVADLTPLLDSLADHHIPLFRPVVESCYPVGDSLACQREFLVQDPDGYLLRFCQFIGDRSTDQATPL